MGKLYDLLNTLIGKVNNSVKVEAQTLTDAQKEQARKNIGAAAEGAGGVQSDWNQTDETAADFIKNKPFGESVANLGDTLTWDGSIVGRHVLYITETFYFARVSDVCPTQADCANGISVSAGGEVLSISPEEIAEMFAPDGSLATDTLFFIPYDGLDYEGFRFNRGVYFAGGDFRLESLTIPGYNFTETTVQKIDEKFVPNATIFYIGADGIYVYRDAACTTKATHDEVMKAVQTSGIIIAHTAVTAYLQPVAVSSHYSLFAVIELYRGASDKAFMLYTAEYTPE